MLTAAALVFAFAQLPSDQDNPYDKYRQPWNRDWDGDPPEWFYNTAEGQFWVQDSQVERTQRSVTFWLHGNHKSAASIPYRTSLWRVTLSCSGTFFISATTTFDEHGVVIKSWDGVGQMTQIRPGTMYQSLEQELCEQ